MIKFKIKVKKSRMWIPALGVVIAYGFFHNCAIAPYFNCRVIDWSQLILTFSVVIGLGGARDIVLQRFRYLGPVQKAIDVTVGNKELSNRFWIPAIGWILVLGYSNNFIVSPYFDIHPVDWEGLLASLSILLTVSGARDYGIYATERKNRREAELRKYEKQQKEISRQEDMIRRFKQRGTEKLAKRAASREKRLAAMDVIDRPEGTTGKMKLSFKADFQSGRDVLYAEGLSKSFGYGSRRTELFHGVDLDIKRGERVCIVGANGIGKTTLLKILMGELSANTGRIKIGHNVQFGYYDQGQQLLNAANTVMGEVRDSYGLYTDTEIRNILGRFLFRGDEVFLTVGSLSGGEKARLSLLKLMLSGANVLMLDEPTNHLDIESKEVFEEALLDFPGTCIIVSHDRYFLNRIPTRIIELTSEGIDNYLGTYDYYVEKKQQQIRSGKKYLEELSAGKRADAPGNGDAAEGAVSDAKAAGGGEPELSSAERRRLQKEKEAEERRLMRHREKLEKDIQELEDSIKALEEELCREDVAKDHVKLAEISKALTEKKDDLDEKYESWLQLQE